MNRAKFGILLWKPVVLSAILQFEKQQERKVTHLEYTLSLTTCCVRINKQPVRGLIVFPKECVAPSARTLALRRELSGDKESFLYIVMLRIF